MKEGYVLYRNGDNLTCLDECGYVAFDGYMQLMLNTGYYHGETDVIGKINKNEEGFFDFSKSIVDIGSEIGVYSFGTNFSFAYMFEGNKDKMIMAQFNMLIRDKSEKFEAHNILLSDKNELVKYDGFCSEFSNVPTEVYKKELEKTVDATFLDSFGIKNIGLIKIDTEGMEEKILRGGAGTIINNNYPPILFELWDVGHWGMTQEKHDSLERFLNELGYNILWYWGDFETHLAVHNK